MNSKSLWNPLSAVNENRPLVKSAEHIYLYDNRGHKYIDANSGLWNVPLGYNNKIIEQAIVDQMNKVCYINNCEFSNDPAIKLSNLLLDLIHDEINKIYFTCTGSESIELAIKLIRKYQSMKFKFKRNIIAVIKHSYHGNFYGSMSCSSYEKDMTCGYGPLLEGFYELSLPFCRCCKSNDLSPQCENKMMGILKSELDAVKDRLAGIIIEPVLGSAGVIPIPNKILKYIDSFSKENDIILAFDEIATGFGRTGSMFYYEELEIKPDIITMSKGINNGCLPLGAVAISKKLTQQFEKSKELLFHLSTQNCNPICCASAVATINLLCKDNFEIIKQVNKKGALFQSMLENNLTNHKNLFDIRRKGLMIAIDYIGNDGEQISKDELLHILKMLRKNNLLTEWSYIDGVTSSIVLFIPYVMTDEELSTVVDIITNVTEMYFQ